jgi:hypothetical protein
MGAPVCLCRLCRFISTNALSSCLITDTQAAIKHNTEAHHRQFVFPCDALSFRAPQDAFFAARACTHWRAYAPLLPKCSAITSLSGSVSCQRAPACAARDARITRQRQLGVCSDLLFSENVHLWALPCVYAGAHRRTRLALV